MQHFAFVVNFFCYVVSFRHFLTSPSQPVDLLRVSHEGPNYSKAPGPCASAFFRRCQSSQSIGIQDRNLIMPRSQASEPGSVSWRMSLPPLRSIQNSLPSGASLTS
jgi:hypothetical protein